MTIDTHSNHAKKGYVVVTGCSSGIGLCVANGLAQRGFNVIATVRAAKQGERLALGAGGHVVLMDLAESASVQAAAAEILALSGGHLYALFNNAAYGQPGAVEDLTRAVLREQFEANVFGTHELTRALLPALLAQPEARIVQNSSVLGFIGMPMRGAYVASKFALEGLSDTLRMELSETSVKLSIIEPGPISSDFRKNALRALQANVDFEASRHGWRYRAALERLQKAGPASRHTLGPEAVLNAVLHALEHSRPKLRYRITTPTHIMAILVRIFPAAWRDRILLRYAQSE